MPWLRPSLFFFMLGTLLLVACTREAPATPAPALPARTPKGPPAQRVPVPTPTISSSQICIETVISKDGKLNPATLTVPRNCVVMFTNRDDSVVQIQGRDGPQDFLLGEMGKDQSWAHTYKNAGGFEFFNTKDPTMRGNITVLP